MISPDLCRELAEYWRKEKVHCQKASFESALFGTELAVIWEMVGMPEQDWWLFRFALPRNPEAEMRRLRFGTLGRDSILQYVPNENVCMVMDLGGNERFANASFSAFARNLVIFDRGCKRIRKECGESDEDWVKGDSIVAEMEKELIASDPRAFESSSSLWPYLLIDING